MYFWNCLIGCRSRQKLCFIQKIRTRMEKTLLTLRFQHRPKPLLLKTNDCILNDLVNNKDFQFIFFDQRIEVSYFQKNSRDWLQKNPFLLEKQLVQVGKRSLKKESIKGLNLFSGKEMPAKLKTDWLCSLSKQFSNFKNFKQQILDQKVLQNKNCVSKQFEPEE